MDPDAIFIMLLWFSLLVLTVIATFGLFKKIWRSGMALVWKILLSLLVLFPNVFGMVKIDTVEIHPVFISIFDIIIYSAAFLIALNWSINLSKKLAKRKRPINPVVSVLVLTIAFTLLIPFIMFQLGNFFDKLNLMGSGG